MVVSKTRLPRRFTPHKDGKKGRNNLKVQKENFEGKVKLTINVEAELLKKKADEAYKKLAKSIKIDGFRPGKAPRHLVEKEIGQDRFNAEVLDAVIPETYYQAVIQEKLNPVSPPEVKMTKFVPTDDLTYEAVVELLPEIKPPNLAEIKIKREEPRVVDKEVQDVLDDLAKQLAKHSKVSRAAKMGDRIEIDFEGFVDGLPFDGNKSKNHPLILGQGNLVPGFEDQLVGMKEKEEKEIEVTFPAEYHTGHLAGKKAKFKIKMHEVNEVILPEINDEFAAKVGPFKDLVKLKVDIKKELLNTKVVQEKNRVESEILERIVEKTDIKAPASLVSQEIHRLVHEAENNLARNGLTLEKYFEMTKKTKEELEKELEPEAEKRVKVGLVLTEVAKEIKAEVADKDVSTEVAERLANVRPEEKKQAEEYLDSHEGRHQIENALIGGKVINYLYEICSK